MSSSGERSPTKVPLPDTPQNPQPIAYQNVPHSVAQKNSPRPYLQPTNSPAVNASVPNSPMFFMLDIDQVERDSTRGSHQGDSENLSTAPSPRKEQVPRNKPSYYQPTPPPPGAEEHWRKQAEPKHRAMSVATQIVSNGEDLNSVKPCTCTTIPTHTGRTSELREGLRRLKTVPDTTETGEKKITSDVSDFGSNSPILTPSPQISSAKEMSDSSERGDPATDKELPAIPQRAGRLERIFKDRLEKVSQKISSDFRKHKKSQSSSDIMTPSPSKIQQCTCGQCICGKSSDNEPYNKESNGKNTGDMEAVEEYEQSEEILAPKVYDPSSPDGHCKDAALDAKKLPTPSDESLGINKHFTLISARDKQCIFCTSKFHGTACCSELFPPSGIKPHKGDHTTFCPTEHMLVNAYAKKINALRKLLSKALTLDLPQGAHDTDGCKYCGSQGHTLVLCRRLFPFLDFKANVLRTEPQLTDMELVERYAAQMRNFAVDSQELICTINDSIRDIARETYLNGSYDAITNGNQGVITVAHLKAALHGIPREKIEPVFLDNDKMKIMKKVIKETLVVPAADGLGQFMIPDTNILLRRARAKLNEFEHDIIACESDKLCIQKKNIIILEGEEGYHFRECMLALRTQQFRNRLESQGGSTFEAKIEERSERKAVENALLRAKVLELSGEVESLKTTLNESKGAPNALLIENCERNEKSGAKDEESESDKENEEPIEKITKMGGVDWFWFT